MDFKKDLFNILKRSAIQAFTSNNAKVKINPSQKSVTKKRVKYSFDELAFLWKEAGRPLTKRGMRDFLASLSLTNSEIGKILIDIDKLQSPPVAAILDVVNKYDLHEYVANVLIGDFGVVPDRSFKDEAELSKSDLVSIFISLLTNDAEVAARIRSKTKESKIYNTYQLVESLGPAVRKTFLAEEISSMTSKKISLDDYYLISSLMIISDLSWNKNFGITPVFEGSLVVVERTKAYNIKNIISLLVSKYGRTHL